MSVTPVDAEGQDRTFTYSCDLNILGRQPKSSSEKMCEFESRGHSKKAQAVARGKEHEAEHETGEPMREIAEFIAGTGQTEEVTSDGGSDD
jgi:hypothetical protein